jgi:hypothetical protein
MERRRSSFVQTLTIGLFSYKRHQKPVIGADRLPALKLSTRGLAILSAL